MNNISNQTLDPKVGDIIIYKIILPIIRFKTTILMNITFAKNNNLIGGILNENSKEILD